MVGRLKGDRGTLKKRRRISNVASNKSREEQGRKMLLKFKL